MSLLAIGGRQCFLVGARAACFGSGLARRVLARRSWSGRRCSLRSIPASDNPLTPEKIALGRMLFFEPRVSLDGTVSCSRCHQPGLYSTDALPKPIGVLHRENSRNAPVIFNAALQIAAHWRGDRKYVEGGVWFQRSLK